MTPRGAHIASLIMAGVQHAMLVNDVCGAPIHRSMIPPWLYFDGKLFQYKLLKASSAPQVQLTDLCDGQVCIRVYHKPIFDNCMPLTLL